MKSKFMKRMMMINLCFVLLIAFCTSVNALPNNWPERVVITSGPIGGPWYPGAVSFSERLMKKFPGLNVTVIEGGGMGNIRLVDKGFDAQIGLTYASTLYQAREGEYDNVKYTNAEGCFAYQTAHMQYTVRADSDIYSIADLKDKRIVPGRIGWSSEIIFRTLLKQYDLDYDKIRNNGGKIIFAGNAEMPSMVKDNHADFILLGGNLNHHVMIDIQSRIPLRILPIEESKMKAVIEEWPGMFEKTVPTGIFQGNKKPVDVLALPSIFICNKDLPEDFMYELTKVYMEMAPEIKEYNPILDLWAEGWEAGKFGLSKEIMNPGCLRAFEEAGYGF